MGLRRAIHRRRGGLCGSLGPMDKTVVELLDEMVAALKERSSYEGQLYVVTCFTPGCTKPALHGATHPATLERGNWCLWCLQRFVSEMP